MKLIYFFFLLELGHEASAAYPDKWMTVPLDHSNLFDNRTWEMRYKVRRSFFRRGNPLFIEIGGEWTIDGSALLSGQMYKLAKKHHGMLVETEHRYYGKSLPFGENATLEEFKYLQMEQALEDLAFFIDKFKQSTKGLENSLVVIHGCSYPGMLATWMRLRFPHIVDIAYASSAPLGVGLDYPEFYEIAHDVYANVNEGCIQTIRDGFNKTVAMLKTKKGRKKVRKALEDWDCGDPREMSSGDILRTMASVLNVLNDPQNYEDVSCLILAMDEDDSHAFNRLASLVVLKSKDQESCGGDGESEDDGGEGQRNNLAWSYQTCTEMGTFQTLSRDNAKNPFGFDLSVQESVDECVNDFGGIVTEEILRTGVERVTRRYGGKKPPVTKVVSVHGTDDPWKHLSDLHNFTSEAPVFVVKGNHCVDLSEGDDIPEEVVKVQKDVRDIISRWIKELRPPKKKATS
ncbi:hypothetical protein PPYR_02780 [Photinus pyralis]|uniref:Uncharacterized protein n=1 Tax=Photinus pyralis TaxID=7054 RepID=A0A5N4A0Y8_PHOPY|nr:putative serine protease K12H4.7 [Photinus pyralis]KAB0790980.1 hypothetical protein PPYR_02780 [Photinus pyralis]